MVTQVRRLCSIVTEERVTQGAHAPEMVSGEVKAWSASETERTASGWMSRCTTKQGSSVALAGAPAAFTSLRSAPPNTALASVVPPCSTPQTFKAAQIKCGTCVPLRVTHLTQRRGLRESTSSHLPCCTSCTEKKCARAISRREAGIM